MPPPSADPELHRLSAGERALLTALALALLLPGTFATSLTDRDEGWYAQVSREMLATGDWLVPRYLGEPWLAKPPLLYWLVAISFRFLGVAAGPARLVSVLAMVGTVHVLAGLTAQMYQRRAGLLAALTFVTAGLPLVVGKLVLTDALLLLWTVTAAALLWQIATRGATWKRSAGFWLCIGLGLLTKGPAILLFVLAAAIGLVTLPRSRAWLRRREFWITGGLAVFVAAPWYIYIAVSAGGRLADQFLWFEFLSRLTQAPHGQSGPPGYHVAIALAGWLPWTVLVPGAVSEIWRERKRDPHATFLLIWAFAPWIVLELARSKLPHYALPCYVPLGIMLGRMWDRGLARRPTRGQTVVLLTWAAVPFGLGAALFGVGLGWRGATWAAPLALAGGVLAAGFGAVGWLVWRGRILGAFGGALLATGGFYIVQGTWTAPALEPYRLSREVAEVVNEEVGLEERIIVSGYAEPTVFFYLERPARVVGPDELRAVLRGIDASVGAGAENRATSRKASSPEEGRRHVVAATAAALEAAGLSPRDLGPNARRVEGFNYVRGEHVTVWVGRVGGVGQVGPRVTR